MLDRRLQIDASAFHYDYSNLQTQRTVLDSHGSPTSIVENAATSTIDGAEFNIAATPAKDLTLNTGLTLLDARYGNYDVGGGVDFSKTRLIRAPVFSSNVAVDFTPTVSASLRLVAHADWSHTSSFYFEPGEARIATANRQNAYDLVNLRIGFEWNQWSATVFATNVFNKRYFGAVDTIPGTSTPFGVTGNQSRGYYAAPRMLGGRLASKF